MEDDNHSNLHAESLVLVKGHFSSQAKIQKEIYQKVFEKRENLIQSLEENKASLVTNVQKIQDTIDAEYEELRQNLVKTVEEAKQRAKTRIQNSLESRLESLNEMRDKLLVIKPLSEVSEKRDELVKSLLEEIDRPSTPVETSFFISVVNCSAMMITEFRRARLLCDEVDECQKDTDCKTVEFFEKMNADYQQAIKEDCALLDTYTHSFLEARKKETVISHLFKDKVDVVLSNELKKFEASSVALNDSIKELEGLMFQPAQFSKERLPLEKVLGVLTRIRDINRLKVTDEAISGLTKLSIIKEILKSDIKKYLPPPPVVEKEKIPIQVQSRNPLMLVKPERVVQKKVYKNQENNYPGKIPARPDQKELSAHISSLGMSLKPHRISDFQHQPDNYQRQNPQKTQMISFKKNESDNIHKLDWVLKRLNELSKIIPSKEDLPSNKSGSEDSSHEDQFYPNIKTIERMHEEQKKTKKNQLGNSLLDSIAPRVNLFPQKMSDLDNFHVMLPPSLAKTGRARLSKLVTSNKPKHPSENFDLGKRAPQETQLSFEEEDMIIRTKSKKQSQNIEKNTEAYDKWILPVESSFKPHRKGFKEDADVLKPKNLNVQQPQADQQSEKRDKERKIVKYKLSRSYEGIIHQNHTCKSLSEGKSYYFTGNQPQDYIEVQLMEDVYVSGVVIEPPMVSSNKSQCFKKIEGARVQISQDGIWKDIGKVEFHGKKCSEFKVNQNAKAIRLAHGTNIEHTVCLGVGRITVLC